MPDDLVLVEVDGPGATVIEKNRQAVVARGRAQL